MSRGNSTPAKPEDILYGDVSRCFDPAALPGLASNPVPFDITSYFNDMSGYVGCEYWLVNTRHTGKPAASIFSGNNIPLGRPSSDDASVIRKLGSYDDYTRLFETHPSDNQMSEGYLSFDETVMDYGRGPNIIRKEWLDDVDAACGIERFGRRYWVRTKELPEHAVLINTEVEQVVAAIKLLTYDQVREELNLPTLADRA
jgi:hypothetical protein